MNKRSACLAITLAAWIPTVATAGFLPPNLLHLEDELFRSNGMTEEEFNTIIDDIHAIYSPIVGTHGGTLKWERRWTDSTVNAYAPREGNEWIIEMYGGLARRPEITPDGFALVACHELGHHLGGYPFKGYSYAAAEGEADYFATQVCLRTLWKNDASNADFRRIAPATVRRECDLAWSESEEQDLCYRIALAGKSSAELLNALEDGNPISFDTPDTRTVEVTDISHPAAQCRLDTYFAAARCRVAWNDSLIPGAKARNGRNSTYAEREAARQSCFIASQWLNVEDFNGQVRPSCWFRHQLTSQEDVHALPD